VLAFSAPYSIEGGLSSPLLDFARITGPSLGSTLSFVFAVSLLFTCYLVSVALCVGLEGSRRALLMVLGLGTLAAFALLGMYPIFSLDVFYYMSADRIWSVYRENPFVVPPLQGAHDPFFPYTAWGHYPLPYGPLWPWISAATGFFGGGAIQPTLVAFKGLAVLGYLMCLPILLWALDAIRPERRLTGLAIFAWNPLVLLELAGGGHNDAIALVPAIAGLGLWARRGSIGTAIAGAISFLVKATFVVALPALLWPSFRTAWQQRRAGWWLLAHGVPVAALCALAWAPFWAASDDLSFLREVDQYYHSVTAVVMAVVPPASRDTAHRFWQVLLLAAFGLYNLAQLPALSTVGRDALRAVWRIVVVYFVLISPFYSGWYMVWPTLIAGLLVERRTTYYTTLLCIGGLATYLVQFVIQPVAGASIDASVLGTLGLLVAAGPFLTGWSWVALRDRLAARSALASAVGPA